MYTMSGCEYKSPKTRKQENEDQQPCSSKREVGHTEPNPSGQSTLETPDSTQLLIPISDGETSDLLGQANTQQLAVTEQSINVRNPGTLPNQTEVSLSQTYTLAPHGSQGTQIGDKHINQHGKYVFNAPVQFTFNQNVAYAQNEPEQAPTQDQLSEELQQLTIAAPQNQQTQQLTTTAQQQQQQPSQHYQLKQNIQRRSSTSIIMSIQEELKEKVEAICNKPSSMADFASQPITPVDLAIANKPRNLDDELQGYKLNIEDCNNSPNQSIAPQDLFLRAKKKAEEEAEHKFTPEQVAAKQNYVEKHGNVVGVIGHAGIGKTVCAKKWSLQGLRAGLFGTISFFFLIVVRDLDFRKSMTFLQFLLSVILPHRAFNLSCRQVKKLLKAIDNDPHVLIVVDGYDESNFKSFSSEAPVSSLYSTDTPETFLKNLSGGELLPKSRKIFFSRPPHIYKLHTSHRPKYMVQILGLTSRSQDELGQQICGRDYAEIKKKMSDHSSMFVQCYIPANFILTLNFLMNYDGDIEFVTLTRVLTFTCDQYSRTTHLRGKNCQIDKLSKLAWNGFENKQVLFYQKDLIDIGIEASKASAFLNTSVTKNVNLNLTILDGDQRIYFSHLIWQEYFAAVYLMMLMPLDDFNKKYKKMAKIRYEMVAKFAFGICDGLVSSQIRSFIPNRPHDLTDKRILLCKLIAQKTRKHQINVARVSALAHEANDTHITSSFASALPAFISLYESSLLLHDIYSLCYVFSHIKDKKIKMLNLSGNDIGDKGMKLIAKFVQLTIKLELCNCDIGPNGVEELCKGIHTLTTPMQSLALSKNMLGNRGATFLAGCIHNIEELELRNCGIGPAGVEELAKFTRILIKPLKSLKLSENELGSLGIQYLVRCIHNIQTLVLCKCNIGGEGVRYLAEAIEQLPNPMLTLKLNRQPLGEGITHLAMCIRKILKLELRECEIDSSGVDELCDGIKGLEKPMVKLNLTRNKFGDVGATCLSHYIYNLQKLDLCGCGITCDGVEILSKAAANLETAMQKLDLSFNKVGDKGAIALSKSVNRIAKLILCSCGVAGDGAKQLFNEISDLENPMTKLDLSYNKQITYNDVSDALPRCSNKLQNLFVCSCGFTEDEIRLLQSHSSIIVRC